MPAVFATKLWCMKAPALRHKQHGRPSIIHLPFVKLSKACMQVVITSYDMMWRLTCAFCCAGGSAARKGRASAKDLPPACLGSQVLNPLALQMCRIHGACKSNELPAS